MKSRVVVLTFLLSGCGAAMVNTRGSSTSQFAPTNEHESKGGTIKYLNQGESSFVKSRREDAYKQMYDYCQGPYRITSEYAASEGGAAITGKSQVDTTFYEPEQFWYLDFDCEKPQPK